MRANRIRIYAPVLLYFLLLFMYLMDMQNLRLFLANLVICFVYALFSTETARFIVWQARRRYPGLPMTRRRFRWMATYGPLFSLTVSFAAQCISFALGGYQQLRLLDYTFLSGMLMMSTLLVILAYEAIYYIENWKVLYAESEQLKQANLVSQYTVLRNQVQPHFLFNSLNTLSSIIISDPPAAERFVEELSSVYRYLLKKNERDMTTLQEELSFLESYITLLKTRFGNALQVHMDILPLHHQYLLPPLALQLLLENAVKHNIVSRDKPLFVTISTDQEHNLHIRNNLQKKEAGVESGQLGLQHLVGSYALVKRDHLLRVVESRSTFEVILPLSHPPMDGPVPLPDREY